MLRNWRLILDEPRGAAMNMAVDEAILRFCAEGSSLPTLRIYNWLRPSVSFGCLQSVSPEKLDIDYCRKADIEIVRRITGGRAVVHGGDVTFSISLPERDLPDNCTSILASHQWLMGAIVAGLQLLDIAAAIGPDKQLSSSPSAASPDCFAHIAECDIRVGEEKAVGSAQVRRYGGLLEQGSIPYANPDMDLNRFFGKSAKPCRPASWLPTGVDFESIANALAGGFAGYFRVPIKPGTLSTNELNLAQQLAEEKYSTNLWTYRCSRG